MDIAIIVKYGGSRRLKVMQTVLSAISGGIQAKNIYIVGQVEDLHNESILENCSLIEHCAAAAGFLGQLINKAHNICENKYLLIVDDDIFFPDKFFEKLRLNINSNDEVISFGVMNVDGSRFWDSAVSAPEHKLMPYGWTTRYSYITGGALMVRRDILKKFPFSNTLPFGNGEDVEWSSRIINAGVRWRQLQSASVLHNDGRYFQNGSAVNISDNLSHLCGNNEANYTRGERFVPLAHGRKIDRGELQSSLLWGWHSFEDWGAWMSKKTSFIRFYTDSSAQVIQITFRKPSLSTMGIINSFSGQELISNAFLSKNFEDKFTLSFTQRKARYAGPIIELFIKFQISDLTFAEKNDDRSIGMGIENIYIH